MATTNPDALKTPELCFRQTACRTVQSAQSPSLHSLDCSWIINVMHLCPDHQHPYQYHNWRECIFLAKNNNECSWKSCFCNCFQQEMDRQMRWFIQSPLLKVAVLKGGRRCLQIIFDNPTALGQVCRGKNKLF